MRSDPHPPRSRVYHACPCLFISACLCFWGVLYIEPQDFSTHAAVGGLRVSTPRRVSLRLWRSGQSVSTGYAEFWSLLETKVCVCVAGQPAALPPPSLRSSLGPPDSARKALPSSASKASKSHGWGWETRQGRHVQGHPPDTRSPVAPGLCGPGPPWRSRPAEDPGPRAGVVPWVRCMGCRGSTRFSGAVVSRLKRVCSR